MYGTRLIIVCFIAPTRGLTARLYLHAKEGTSTVSAVRFRLDTSKSANHFSRFLVEAAKKGGPIAGLVT